MFRPITGGSGNRNSPFREMIDTPDYACPNDGVRRARLLPIVPWANSKTGVAEYPGESWLAQGHQGKTVPALPNISWIWLSLEPMWR